MCVSNMEKEYLEYLKNELLEMALTNEDDKARKRLIEANLRYVVKLASKYANMGYPIEEIIQEGNKGLVYSTYKYDVRLGNTFLSYATWWI